MDDILKELTTSTGFEVNRINEEKFYEHMADYDGVIDLLKDQMSVDMKNYFALPKESQEMIKGGFFRTQHMLNKILEIKRARAKK